MCSISCLVNAVASLLLLLSFLACSVGFASPFWIHFELSEAAAGGAPGVLEELVHLPRYRQARGLTYAGLTARCFADNAAMPLTQRCQWFWQNDFELENQLPDWHKAAQGLYAFGLVILKATVLLSLVHLCCRCCRKSFSMSTIIGTLTISGFFLMTTAIALFAAFEFKEAGVSVAGGKGQFAWGCYVGVAGVVAALLAAILFVCDGCRDSSSADDAYETSRMI